jgi:hypothetical protein
VSDSTISGLAGAAAAAGTNELEINEAGTSKKITIAQIEAYFESRGMPQVYVLAADHTISSVTGTEVTGLGPITLQPGTYVFEYYLLCQSATATVSPLFAINFTGTATRKNMWLDYADASATLLAMQGIADAQGTTALGFAGRQAQNAYATATGNMGFVAGVDPINADILVKITGVIVVTVAGDLELWHASETATATSVMSKSSCIVHRVA